MDDTHPPKHPSIRYQTQRGCVVHSTAQQSVVPFISYFLFFIPLLMQVRRDVWGVCEYVAAGWELELG